MQKIILASSSQYRKEVFTRLRIPFDVVPSHIDESVASTLPPKERPEFLAIQKVAAVASSLLSFDSLGSPKGPNAPAVPDAAPLQKDSAAATVASPAVEGTPHSLQPTSVVECAQSVSAASSLQSASAVSAKLSPKPLILGFDTLIVFDSAVYGKPQNRAEAATFLTRFSGNTHSVITATALYNGETGKTVSRVCETAVTFARLTKTEIDSYLNTNEWQNAAGAYRIQGVGACFVRSINGSYSAVAGLPIFDLYEILKAQNYVFM